MSTQVKVRIVKPHGNHRVGRMYIFDADEAAKLCKSGVAVPYRSKQVVEQATAEPEREQRAGSDQ